MKKATESLAAEQSAAEAEGFYAPTTEQMRLLKRYKELGARKAAIETEQTAIRNTLVAYLDENNGRAISVNGKNWVLISDSHRTVVDREKFEAEFPELVAEYSKAALKFTSRVRVERSTVKIDPR